MRRRPVCGRQGRSDVGQHRYLAPVWSTLDRREHLGVVASAAPRRCAAVDGGSSARASLGVVARLASNLRIEERVPERGTRRAPVPTKTWVPNPPSSTPLSGRSQRPLFFWYAACGSRSASSRRAQQLIARPSTSRPPRSVPRSRITQPASACVLPQTPVPRNLREEPTRLRAARTGACLTSLRLRVLPRPACSIRAATDPAYPELPNTRIRRCAKIRLREKGRSRVHSTARSCRPHR